MAYTKYSLTPADNNAAPPNGAPEGMLPSAVNDTMRDMMAQIRDCGDGIRGGTYTMTAPVITGGSITGASVSATSLTDSGNLAFTGTGNRITGDFSNATQSNRVLAQSSTTNGNTVFGVIPNGTSTTSAFRAFNNSTPTNASTADLSALSTDTRITSGIVGTGTYLPLTFYTNNAEAMRIDTNGLVDIGTTTSSGQLTVKAASGQGAPLNLSTTDAGANTQVVFTGARTFQIGTGNSSSGFANSLFFYDGTASAERMRINSSGNICIGSTSELASNTRLSVTGSASGQGPITVRNGNASSGKHWKFGPDTSSNNLVVYNQDGVGVYLADGNTTWYANSDERLKTDLTPILDGLAKVNSLRSVTGRYKTDEEGKSRAFLIAQDVQKVLPEAITEKDGYLGVGYADTIPLLVAAIKELSAKVDAQAAEIAALKAGA